MKSFFNAITLISILPVVLGLTVNTPTSVVQCQPVLFSWTDGTAPYFLSLIPPSQPSAAAIKQFQPQQGTSITWIADLAGGSSFSIALKDSTGAVAYSQAVNIQTSSNSSCVNTSVQEGSSSAAAASVSGSSTTGASNGTVTPTKTGTTTGTSTPTGTTKSGASRTVMFGAFEMVVLLGLVGVALL